MSAVRMATPSNLTITAISLLPRISALPYIGRDGPGQRLIVMSVHLFVRGKPVYAFENAGRSDGCQGLTGVLMTLCQGEIRADRQALRLSRSLESDLPHTFIMG